MFEKYFLDSYYLIFGGYNLGSRRGDILFVIWLTWNVCAVFLLKMMTFSRTLQEIPCHDGRRFWMCVAWLETPIDFDSNLPFSRASQLPNLKIERSWIESWIFKSFRTSGSFFRPTLKIIPFEKEHHLLDLHLVGSWLIFRMWVCKFCLKESPLCRQAHACVLRAPRNSYVPRPQLPLRWRCPLQQGYLVDFRFSRCFIWRKTLR